VATAPAENTSDAKRILVMDDDDDTLAILRMVLKKEGYKIDLATDGVEGLQLLRDRHHDLVISDVMMPKLDGYKFVETVRQDPSIRTTPIILITAKKETEDKVAGLEKGADDYITKPYNLVELRARIASMLRLKELRRELMEAEKELERIRTLEQTLMTISHHVNNAIAPISGRAQLCSPKDPSSVQKLIDACHEGSRRIAETMAMLEKVIAEMKDPSKHGSPNTKLLYDVMQAKF
jgi:CheY-like chemotaxis protein